MFPMCLSERFFLLAINCSNTCNTLTITRQAALKIDMPISSITLFDVLNYRKHVRYI